MNYKIDTFQKDYIKDQVRIGADIFNKWKFGGQTTEEQLLKTYASPNFDPTTRFYALDQDGKVHGFLTAEIKEDGNSAWFEFPYIEEAFRDEINEFLIEHAIKSLKSRGVKKLVTRAGPYWEPQLLQCQKYGFIQEDPIVYALFLDLNQFNLASDVVEYDPIQHSDILKAHFMDKLKVPVDQVDAALNRVNQLNVGDEGLNPWNIKYKLVARGIKLDKGEIIGRVTVLRTETFPKNESQIIGGLYAKDNSTKITRDLLRFSVESSLKRGYDRVRVHIGMWGAIQDYESLDKIGLTLPDKPVLSYYSKEI